MEILYPGARWRPLGTVTDEPAIGVPRVLIVHTMVGYLLSTERMFHRDGYSGTESTFGIGGPHDTNLDGVVFQWQRLDREADAQYDGNAYATSVETSDGGHPDEPWSPKQVAALAQLIAWWCHTTGNPCVLVKTVSDHGIGYHRQFPQWNRANHSCPGSIREHQLVNQVIPAAQRILHPPAPKPTPTPTFPAWPFPSGHWLGIPSSNPRNHSGYWSKDRPGIATWQRQMVHRGWKGITIDGRFSPADAAVAAAFAREKRHIPAAGAGHVDEALWRLAWTAPVTR